MKRFSQIITLLLLALMVPASMCCWGADGCVSQKFSSCSTPEHDEHEDEHQHDGDGHHSPTSCPSDTISHSQVPAQVAIPVLEMVELADLILAMIHLHDELATLTESSGLPMTTAPPELRATWHFTSRAALPARAPSSQA